jgi:RimJ/RimL family protein N-acetyltransferase
MFEKVIAEANPKNLASRRVLEKAGFKKSKYKEEVVKINGAWLDGLVYELTRLDWRRY